MDAEEWTLGGRQWSSRLIAGTGGFRHLDVLERSLAVSGAEIVTVALRRVDPTAPGSLIETLDRGGYFVLPNTAGCYTARDAVATAQLAREALGTDWVKLEVIGDERTLLPDAAELLARPSSSCPMASSCCRTPAMTRSWRNASRTSDAPR